MRWIVLAQLQVPLVGNIGHSAVDVAAAARWRLRTALCHLAVLEVTLLRPKRTESVLTCVKSKYTYCLKLLNAHQSKDV